MDLNFLERHLKKEKFLKQIIYLEEIDSTNSYAKKNKLSADTLVLTSSQTTGRGRFSRKWISAPYKDLTFTLVKHFNLVTDEIHLVNFYTSYILFLTLKEFFSGSSKLKFSLKWPNDILLNGKKVAGILTDVSNLNKPVKKFIIGIGINVNSSIFPEELKSIATSLLKEFKSEINPEELLIVFINKFYTDINLIFNKDVLMKEWSRHEMPALSQTAQS